MKVLVTRTGSANTASVLAGLRRVGADPFVSIELTEIERAERLVLPGVGAFGAARAALDAAGLTDALRARVAAGVAFGLALVGMLAARGLESAAPAGHAPIEGGIDRLDALALEMFGRYGLAFEATGMLLLVTMVAVIALAKRQRPRGTTPPSEDEGSRA